MRAFSVIIMIKITDKIKIEEWEITESFMRSSGPGGQHVNKVSSREGLARVRIALASRTRDEDARAGSRGDVVRVRAVGARSHVERRSVL